jgi:alkylation response protein AidB-like acyl-CoA dehydrogenase
MNFQLSPDLVKFLKDLDAFIEVEIHRLQKQDDNNRFFDHRREWARTDFENRGLPRPEWEQLLAECRNRADKAGFYRFHLPREWGGEQVDGADGRGSNLWMAVIREHLASKGLGLFNDLQSEHSVVGNFGDIVMVKNFGTEKQKHELINGRLGMVLWDGSLMVRRNGRLEYITRPTASSSPVHLAKTATVKELHALSFLQIPLVSRSNHINGR